MRAAVEYNSSSDETPPPVKITIVKGKEDLSIKVLVYNKNYENS